MDKFTIVLATLGVAAWALVIMKFYQMYIVRKITQKEMSKEIIQIIKTKGLEEALKTEQVNGPELVSQMARAGIIAALNKESKEVIQERIDSFLMMEVNKVEAHLGKLALVANLATFSGLIGTIIGLINSFAGVSMIDPDQKAKVLSEGIGLAMNCTGMGLLVAVPVLIAYAVLNNRSSRITDDLNKAGLNLFIQLGYHYSPQR